MPKSYLCAAWPLRSGEGGGHEARSPGSPSACGYGAHKYDFGMTPY